MISFQRWFRRLLLFLLLSPSALEAASLHLSWQDNSNNESGFKIERSSNGAFTEIASVAANVSFYTDSSVNNGSTYCYQVRAFNSDGVSAPTNLSCANVPATSVSVDPPSSDGGSGTDDTTATTPPTPTLTAAAGRWTNYRLQVNIASMKNGAIGVLFRYVDSRNYYQFVWNQRQASRRLLKVVNGAPVILAQDSVPYVTKQTYQLEIVAQDAALTVLIDNQVVLSASDSSLTEGTVALYSHSNKGSVFDDVLVQDLATGNTLLSDNFDDGNFIGWTVINDQGPAAKSKWSVSGGALVQKSTLGTYALYTKKSWTDYHLTAKLRSMDSGSIGVIFRFTDTNNYYRFSWNGRAVSRRLEKITNGAMAVLAEDSAAYAPGQTYEVKITAAGSTLAVSVNGQPVFSVADASFNSGGVALYSYINAGSIFDEVLVEDASTGAVLLWDDFDNGNFQGWTVVDQATKKSAPSSWSVINGELVQSSKAGAKGQSNPGSLAFY